MTETYFSIDVESDGPIPPKNSMLSLGCVAFDPNGQELGSYSCNFELLENAKGDPDTMAWWAKNQHAYDLTRTNLVSPTVGMQKFVDWTNQFRGPKVAVAFPAGYDWTWTYYYLMNFVGQSPFGFQCLDIKTYAMSVLNTDFKQATKRNFPREWFPDIQHNHVAETDAREQGLLFCNILKYQAKHNVR